MPVTAKLSRKFYEKFGDDITNELVDWFNKVDATYRSDLRELNEVNFARFDARLEQRAAQLDAKIEQLRAELKAALTALEARLDARMSAFETRIIRWMFLFWVGQAVTTVGLVFGVVRLTGR
ncbi:MAG: hypothetical protein DMD34_14285 [Gemmatimonadetes bacterium]|nr:MAG: hypothetical protein DMD46_16510 [Gemmatimonadota bacterium]PYP92427.1 MAG: hypothetical protein DMD34_14285 [Gemmatimonadota bacterium]